jgi:hypothetical protein
MRLLSSLGDHPSSSTKTPCFRRVAAMGQSRSCYDVVGVVFVLLMVVVVVVEEECGRNATVRKTN